MRGSDSTWGCCLGGVAGEVPAGEGLVRVWVELVHISVLFEAETLPGECGDVPAGEGV
jgi:hypothetical protein